MNQMSEGEGTRDILLSPVVDNICTGKRVECRNGVTDKGKAEQGTKCGSSAAKHGGVEANSCWERYEVKGGGGGR